MTRRDLFKFASIGTAGLILAPGLSLLEPQQAHAASYEITTISDRSFLGGQSITIDDKLCSSVPDSVSVSGSTLPRLYNSFGIGIPDGYGVIPGREYRANLNTNIEDATFKAIYNCVGTFNGRNVGCETIISNAVECLHNGQEQSYGATFNYKSVAFQRFSLWWRTIWLIRYESADIEQRFFYSDTNETISCKDMIVTVGSLNHYEDFKNRGNVGEGVQLPSNVKTVYLFDKSEVVSNVTVHGRKTYTDIICGDVSKSEHGSDQEDGFRARAVSWVVPGDTVKYKAVSTYGYFGLNITFQPIANTTPINPIKSYKLSN